MGNPLADDTAAGGRRDDHLFDEFGLRLAVGGDNRQGSGEELIRPHMEPSCLPSNEIDGRQAVNLRKESPATPDEAMGPSAPNIKAVPGTCLVVQGRRSPLADRAAGTPARGCR